MILAIIAVVSTVILVLSTINVMLWKVKLKRVTGFLKGVSILKPIRGNEPELEANIHSFFNLKTSVPFELLFSVKNENDPAVETVRKLQAMHPQIASQLFVGTPDLGRNPKVSNMHYAWNRASYDLMLISDSNVRVEPDYLEVLLQERQQGAGLVTQAVYATDAQELGGHLDVVHLNSFYLKGTSFLDIFGISCVLGKCMFFSRYQFDRMGGLFSVRNYLAEDLMIGQIMKEAGYEAKLLPRLLRQTTVMRGFGAYWNRHVRWARLRKCHFFGAYLIEPLLFETLWPLLLLAVSTTAREHMLAYMCLLLQITTNIILHQFKFRDNGSWKSLKYFWLKDIIAPVIWMGGLVSNRVIWRGHHLSLRFGGKLGTRYTRAARASKLRFFLWG